MVFKRKVYDKLLEWKANEANDYAVLLEGPRRVGKSTIVREFARSEYRSHIFIDFSIAEKELRNCFNDISDLDGFFARLQAITKTKLYKNQSVIVFDEIQLFPPARQAIKHLVADGRYHYIETGSLISIRQNVKDILIPSEEMVIPVYPMDYEEFCMATGKDFSLLRSIYEMGESSGHGVCRSLMRDFRIYMLVGGMPQAVDAYVNNKTFAEIDGVKRRIIKLYEDDFAKIDKSGVVADIFRSIPAQLARNSRRFYLSRVTSRYGSVKDQEALFELVNSRTVLPCYNTTDPRVSLSGTKNRDCFKLYLADTGLFVTQMFMDRPSTENIIYTKMLSDKLPADLGYLYENMVAQIIAASGRELYYHTWEKKDSTHYYEVDFLLARGAKVDVIEVKSSGVGKHESIKEFQKKFSKHVGDCYVVSQKDVAAKENIKYLPVFMMPFLAEW